LTITTEGISGSLNVVNLDWLSDAGGNVVATTNQVSGTIERLVFNPDGGSTIPTAAYDVVLNDRDGVDMLNGTGANLTSGTVKTIVVTDGDGTTNLPMATAGELSLAVTNAGNAKGGIIRFYLRR
jgi:hypothetical protein